MSSTPPRPAPFVPAGLRPVGVYPAAPRVVYRTVRKNIGHEARIRRIDRVETLEIFRGFSRDFQAFRPRPEPELAAYLHNRGFLPDKAGLYDLPSERVDAFLSDYQAAILPMVNGRYAEAGDNRLFLWQLHRSTLPLAPLAALHRDGRAVAIDPGPEDGLRGGILLARPLRGRLGSRAEALETVAQGAADGGDRLILHLPEGMPQEVIRLGVLHDPVSNLPFVLAATLFEAPPDRLDLPDAALACRPIDPETGEIGPRHHFVRGLSRAAEIDSGPAQSLPALLPAWWPLVGVLMAGLRRLPVWAAIQIDAVILPDGPRIIDMTCRFDTGGLQVHGPIMGSERAVSFIKRYGL